MSAFKNIFCIFFSLSAFNCWGLQAQEEFPLTYKFYNQKNQILLKLSCQGLTPNSAKCEETEISIGHPLVPGLYQEPDTCEVLVFNNFFVFKHTTRYTWVASVTSACGSIYSRILYKNSKNDWQYRSSVAPGRTDSKICKYSESEPSSTTYLTAPSYSTSYNVRCKHISFGVVN